MEEFFLKGIIDIGSCPRFIIEGSPSREVLEVPLRLHSCPEAYREDPNSLSPRLHLVESPVAVGDTIHKVTWQPPQPLQPQQLNYEEGSH